ncbi:MAG: hypothetical protein U1G05_05435 [Kiritimatiellia bacterium]
MATGSTTPPVSLDFEGDEGALLQVSGHIVLDVFGFVSWMASSPSRRPAATFLLNDSTALTAVPYLSVGGNITTATVAAGGVALNLHGVEFGMVLVNNAATTYTAVKAKVGSADLTGITGLGLTVTDLPLGQQDQQRDRRRPGARLRRGRQPRRIRASRWRMTPPPRRSASTSKATRARCSRSPATSSWTSSASSPG